MHVLGQLLNSQLLAVAIAMIPLPSDKFEIVSGKDSRSACTGSELDTEPVSVFCLFFPCRFAWHAYAWFFLFLQQQQKHQSQTNEVNLF